NFSSAVLAVIINFINRQDLCSFLEHLGLAMFSNLDEFLSKENFINLGNKLYRSIEDALM
ncbi:MAG: hypothetical protein ACJ0DG_02155, partial [bacterium]